MSHLWVGFFGGGEGVLVFLFLFMKKKQRVSWVEDLMQVYCRVPGALVLFKRVSFVLTSFPSPATFQNFPENHHKEAATTSAPCKTLGGDFEGAHGSRLG